MISNIILLSQEYNIIQEQEGGILHPPEGKYNISIETILVQKL